MKSNRKLKVVEPAPVEEKPIKAESKPEKKSATRAEKSEWKVELKKALFKNPAVTNEELIRLVVRSNYPSIASVVYARAETLHTLGVLKEQKLYSHPGL